MTKKKKEKISIITTFYNASEFVIKAVSSVLCQHIDKDRFCVEYILVDDCSTDDSYEKVMKFIDGCATIDCHLIQPENNLGCGGARRYGIEHATGDYFMFLDADDYYINDTFIMSAYSDITVNDADIVEYGIVFNQANGSSTVNAVSRRIVIDENPRLAMLALFRDNYIKFNVWTKIYRRYVVESYTYSDERMFEDVRTIPVWITKAKRIVIMPTVEINYRASQSSIIRTDFRATRLGTISAIASHFETWKNDPEVLRAMYGRAMIDLEAMLNNNSSENDGFNEMSLLNTKMLQYIYPDSWKDKVFQIE